MVLVPVVGSKASADRGMAIVYTDCGLVSLARLRPIRGRRTRIKYVISLTGLAEAFRHSWYQSKKFLEWLIEEIRVVEEMIRRKVLSV
ncbi:hypothetical protein Taro_002637 [Colocasia esculenta]|uniref:Uncharacterized protein n=1 Tax=Colocasia esculenta TaxID=4460 RepID=A0A843TH24_COLES|nr:hypothetical protein [Colocasia esculenta]